MNNSIILGHLDTDNTIIVTPPAEKKDLVIKLTKLACKGLSEADIKDITDKVLERESGISTTLDTGLSIPHCRVDEIDGFRAALALIPGGLKDPGNPDLVIKAMFLFLSPSKPAFFQQHLQVLVELSETFQENFINKLLSAKTPGEVLLLLKAHASPKEKTKL